MAAALCLMSAGCGKKIESYDKDKKQIFVECYDGGNGVGWLKDLVAQYNRDCEKYEFVVRPSKRSNNDYATLAYTGHDSSVYFTVSPLINMFYDKGLLLDLSEIYNNKADEGESMTVAEKIRELDDYKIAFGGNGEGMFALPYADSFCGLVYDHDLFLEKNWLKTAPVSEADAVKAQGLNVTVSKNALIFESSDKRVTYEKGDKILTAGKDGKYGTYDDGQPENESEWITMLEKISASGAFPFIWSGKNPDYLDDVVHAVFAQYDGIDNYRIFVNYNGDYKNGDAEFRVTPEKGNLVYNFAGLEKGLYFLDKYFTNDERYIHPVTSAGSASHRDAQEKFILGYKNATENPLSAMIVEGTWWENEARANFNQREEGRRYGQRDYRYMLFPALDGQFGIDGQGNGSVLAVRDAGCCIAIKNKDENINKEVIKFLRFTCTDEALKYYTKKTGILKPYKYYFSDEELSELTPFARNCYDLYADQENIAFSRYTVYCTQNSINYRSSKSSGAPFYSVVNNGPYTVPLSGLQRTDYVTYLNGMKSYFTDSLWAKYVAEAK